MTDAATELGADRVKDQLYPRLPGTDVPQSEHVKALAERFRIPPFTQLDARSGTWQDRKQMWYDLGLTSHKGRSARTFAKAAGKDEVSQKILAVSDGQSIFDPVLCELVYLWFAPMGGRILDPFAGGSVRGLVAAFLGYHYVGVDLSPDQIMANIDQDVEWSERGMYVDDLAPTWLRGDAANLDMILDQAHETEPFDLMFTCPPYGDLEVYSDDPRDLSRMPWKDFLRVYGEIIMAGVDRLADDRFAAIVVGEIRDRTDGLYRHFVAKTIEAFERAGAAYYNEAILVSPAGTLPLRAAKQFLVSRKMGRTHQSVLVFVKGDPRKAAEHCMNSIAMDAALRAAGVDPADMVDAGDEDFSGLGHG